MKKLQITFVMMLQIYYNRLPNEKESDSNMSDNIEKANEYKKNREIAQQQFIEKRAMEGISPAVAENEFLESMFARLSRAHEAILRNDGKWEFTALCDADGNVVAHNIVAANIGRGRTKCWKIYPEYVEKIGRTHVVAGKGSHDIQRLNLHLEKRMLPAKIHVEKRFHAGKMMVSKGHILFKPKE